MTGQETPDVQIRPPSKDPWKGLRGVMAGTLILQGMVVLLALPVVWRLGDGITSLGAAYIVVLAVAMFLGCGLQGRSWALKLDIGLQVAMIAGFLVNFTLGALGVLFAFVWAYIFYLRADLQDRIAHGMLPSQRGEPAGETVQDGDTQGVSDPERAGGDG